jgi:hypothetical protein
VRAFPKHPLQRPWSPGDVAIVVLVLGAVLRLAFFLGTATAITPSNDSARYLGSAFAPGGLFTDFLAPSGYPLFLKGIGWLPDRGVSIVVVQHLLGLLTAYGVWALGRRIAGRLGVSAWWAVPGVAFAALSGDLVYFEHSIMTETLSMALLVALALVAERLTRPDVAGMPAIRWVLLGALAGLLVAASYAVRSIGGPTGIVLVGLAVVLRRGVRTQVLVAVGVVLALVGGVALYTAAAEDSKGGKTGFGGMDGWYLYARTSSFAECSHIDPPKDLRALCDPTPPDQRKGLFAYVYRYPEFKVQTPAVRRYQFHPNGNDALREFGLDAVKSQPLDYLKAVSKDLLRYVAPNAGIVPPYSGPGPEFLRLASLSPGGVSPQALHELEVDEVHVGPLATLLEAWSSVTRLPGLLIVLLVVLPPFAVLRCRSRDAAAVVLPVWASAVASAVAPVVLVSYEYRYGLPALLLLMVVSPPCLGVALRRRDARAPASPDGDLHGAAEPVSAPA